MSEKFKYIKERYQVPADMHRVVHIAGKKGVITEDMGNYIGVNFYDSVTYHAYPCHPTWEVEYTDVFDHNPPIKKITRSQRRYREFISSDSGLSFKEWLGIKSVRSRLF